jgi:hypothetical protein
MNIHEDRSEIWSCSVLRPNSQRRWESWNGLHIDTVLATVVCVHRGVVRKVHNLSAGASGPAMAPCVSGFAISPPLPFPLSLSVPRFCHCLMGIQIIFLAVSLPYRWPPSSYISGSIIFSLGLPYRLRYESLIFGTTDLLLCF